MSNIDLSKLSDLSTPDQSCVSVYLSSPKSIRELEKRFDKIRQILKGEGYNKDEREQFEENVKIVQKASGEVDFTDPIETLTQAGGIAALLRYKY